MTEKRFYVAESNLIDGYCVFDREKKYAFHPRPRKADCLNDAHTLNELAEENQEYENEIARLQLINNKLKDKDYTNYKKKIQELQVTTGEMEDYLARMEEENKELKDKSYFKKEIERLRLQNKDLLKSNAKLRDENKELKEELRIYRQVVSCHNCTYQSYNWFDDGDEFEICTKGNNEQQMNYHICKDWREI